MPKASGAAQRVWLFDLDNTLHNATPHIFPHINRAMQAYIERHLGISREEANHLRQQYWTRYGATLLGLMRHHNIPPRHFLWETHQFADLQRMLVFDQTVKSALQRIPGRKIIFSNAPAHYACAILELTGLSSCFSAVYTVDRIGFQPKPMPAGFRALLQSEGLRPKDCILVEDSLDNLIQAKKMGMKTVWVSAGSRGSPWVDVKLRSVRDLPRRLARL